MRKEKYYDRIYSKFILIFTQKQFNMYQKARLIYISPMK